MSRNACKGVLTKKLNFMGQGKGKYEGVQTVDVTPTWESLVPTFINIIRDGKREALKGAEEELKRMAWAADQYNLMVKEGNKERLTEEG